MWFKKKKKKNLSIYLTCDEFKKLAKQRKIQKNERFLNNYYKQLSNNKGLNQKEALHALNCIVINDAAHAKTNKDDDNNIYQQKIIPPPPPIPQPPRRAIYNKQIVDITDTKILKRFIEYISDNRHIKFVFFKVLTNSSNHKHLDVNSIGTFIYELIVDFLRNQCLCKQHQIPSYNAMLSFITSIKSQLSYFNDNGYMFSLGFIIQYLPLIVTRFNQNKDEIKHEHKVNEMSDLQQRMESINAKINNYQADICDIIDDLRIRTNKLKSNTYPEQIDELNNTLNDLLKQIEILSEDLTKLENEQTAAERAAEDLRQQTMQKLNINYNQENKESFNINDHIQSVMDQNIDNILANNAEERRGSTSKSQSKTQSHTIDSHMASTSIRKPFFVRPLGFDVDLDVDSNELFVSDVTLDSQAYKLKVCRGWRIAMVGREDRVSVMYSILKDANKQSNDDDNALPLFITFQVSGLNLT